MSLVGTTAEVYSSFLAEHLERLAPAHAVQVTAGQVQLDDVFAFLSLGGELALDSLVRQAEPVCDFGAARPAGGLACGRCAWGLLDLTNRRLPDRYQR